MGRASSEAHARVLRKRQHRGNDSPLTVAIVGTGIAGETAAYLLSTAKKSASQPLTLCRVYEARAAPGLHANSLELDGCNVDVPLRAISPHYYANLCQLYRHLGVTLQPVDYSTSTSTFYPSKQSSPISTIPTFRYQNALICGFALPFLVWRDVFCWTKLLSTVYILRDFLFLIATGPYLLVPGKLEQLARQLRDSGDDSQVHHKQNQSKSDLTFGQLLRHLGYSRVFTESFLSPMLSTLLSCSYDQVDAYPAKYVLEFFCSRATTFFTGWFRVRCGVQEVSDKLLRVLPEGVLHLNTAAKSVRYSVERDMVCVSEFDGKEEWFDIVIIATEPSVAQRIWTQRTADEDALMSSLEHYDANITVHTDAALLPSQRPQWRGMNVFRHHADACEGPLAASMTSARLANYQTGLHSPTRNSPTREIIETWNCFEQPADGSVLHDIRMTRAVWSGKSKSVYDRLFSDLQGARGVFLIGSYTEPGVTLLEQAVTSAMHVAEDLGVTLPFELRPCYEQRLIVIWASAVVFHVWRCVVVAYRSSLAPLLALLKMTIGACSTVVSTKGGGNSKKAADHQKL